MELKELFAVFAREWKVFWGVIALACSILAAVLWFTPDLSVATVTMTVVRADLTEGSDSTAITEPFYGREDFGSYYHFQADDAFAETVVAWLHTPQIVASIESLLAEESYHLTPTDTHPSKHYKTKRRSSHVIDVVYRAESIEAAHAEARAMTTEINTRAAALSAGIEDATAFYVAPEAPFVERYSHNTPLLSVLTAVIALCVAVMSVLIRHYLR